MVIMNKRFTKNRPAIEATLVGFGQAGSRIVDRFAAKRDYNGKPFYNCLALNSNDGDLKPLKHIPTENRECLNLGGLGKNPEKGIQILEQNEEVRNQLKSFIRDRIRPQDSLIMFFAGLGGGTGTSTILKAIEEFYDFYNKPIFQSELLKIQKKVGVKEFTKNQQKYLKAGLKAAREKYKKIGVVVTLPLRADGADALRQANIFAKRIWKLANDASKGIAFVIFADNQYFLDEFQKLPPNKRLVENFRDYANKQICDIFHELNTATKESSNVTLDSADFRRIILEGSGCLVISRITKNSNEINTGNDVVKMFLEAMNSSSFHEPISFKHTKENGTSVSARVHHLGLLAILSEHKNVGSSFIDEAKIKIVENGNFPIEGTVFTGYFNDKTTSDINVYSFYKTSGLPLRLEKGLLEEYEEFKKRQESIITETTSIQEINDDPVDDFDLGNIDLSDLGIDLGLDEASNDNNENSSLSEEELAIDIDNLEIPEEWND